MPDQRKELKSSLPGPVSAPAEPADGVASSRPPGPAGERNRERWTKKGPVTKS
ncbi:hypothetical protein [Lihuaxuella thermophila]|uniref:Uncharacterized protein n=1 Tax=Lihuaxuella thermophila TaxID=1173111 RepID=A0A1H8BEE8_9BACL|nr:hypothetical protein [Lihuaxuella thermophila]SEM80514.1 hypothetical protein SAMN05444955_102112 [Lihuaxuella thermophila]